MADAGKVTAPMPEVLDALQARPRARRAAPAAPPRWPARSASVVMPSGSPTITSGVRPASISVSAPASTPISTGRNSLMYLRKREGPRRGRRPGATTSTCRPRIGTYSSGTPWPSSTRPRSRRRNSIVLAENASSWADMPALASISWSATDSGVCSTPRASSRSLWKTTPSCSRSLVPSLIARQHAAADVVDERDARVQQRFGAEVGEPPGDRGRGVDHADHLGGDERLRGAAVEVERVEHGDVARPDPAQQVVGAAVHPGDTGDARQHFMCPRQQSGELHVLDGHSAQRVGPFATPHWCRQVNRYG